MNIDLGEFTDRCSSCPIRHRAVCSKCDADELEELNEIKYYKTFPAGSHIMLRGDDMAVVATVVSGVAMLERGMEDGRTQMVGLLLPSDFIGRPGRKIAAYDVRAVTDVTLCSFHRKKFEKLLVEIPHLRERLLEIALDELDAAHDWMLLLGRKTAREKIASLLTLIHNRSRLDGEDAEKQASLTLPVNREDMANFLGLTIETVSRQFSALRKEGVITLEGTRIVHIPDLQRLKDQTGEFEDDEMWATP